MVQHASRAVPKQTKERKLDPLGPQLLSHPRARDIDRQQLPDWMIVPFTRMPIDWELLRTQNGDWLRYWDANICGQGK